MRGTDPRAGSSGGETWEGTLGGQNVQKEERRRTTLNSRVSQTHGHERDRPNVHMYFESLQWLAPSEKI